MTRVSLSHSSMGTTAGYDYVSAKATFDGKTATSSTIKVQNSSYYSYAWKSLSVSYATVSASGTSSLLPTVSGTQTKTLKYTSGSSGSASTINVTPSFDSLTVSGTGCSVYNTQTGAIMWRANTSTSSRSATISGSVTANNVAKSFSTTAYQDGKEEDFYNYNIIIQEESASSDINITLDDDGDFDLNSDHYGGVQSESNNYIEYNGYSSKSTPSLGFTIAYQNNWCPSYFTVEVTGNGTLTTGSYTVYPSQGEYYYYVVKCSGATVNTEGTGIDINIKEYY